MKLFVLMMVGLLIASETYAADKRCLNECRSENTNCLLEVQDWTEDQYLAIEGSITYLKNKEVNQLLDTVETKRKEMKKICKEDFKECKQACKEN